MPTAGDFDGIELQVKEVKEALSRSIQGEWQCPEELKAVEHKTLSSKRTLQSLMKRVKTVEEADLGHRIRALEQEHG